MQEYSIYRLGDGTFTGRRLTGSPAHIAANMQPGCAAWAGAVDHTRWRVDGGCLVPYLPPRPSDTAAQMWQLSAAGDEWVASPTDAAIAIQARAERDRRLADCDWVSLRAADAGTPVPAVWRSYRQALRDVSQQPGWPCSVVWPVPPT